MSKLNVTLNVADIPVRIKVEPQDEGYIRNGVADLNDIVASYKINGPEKEHGYYLALAAIQCAARARQLQRELELLKESDKRLSAALNQ